MPASAVPIVGAVVTALAFFIVLVGGAGVWTSMPGRLHQDRARGVNDDL